MKKPYKGIEPGDYTRPGVTITSEGVNFTLAVKGDQKAELLLYGKRGQKPIAEIPMGEKLRGDLCSVKLTGFCPEGFAYNYRIGNRIVADPYARRILGRKEFGEEIPMEEKHRIRGGFDTEEYDWEGDRAPKIPWEDGILYLLHVRGFTKSPASRVKKKGTFHGLMEKIPYLQDLGVNQVLLMPIYEFEERLPKLNCWGYGKANYFAPKASYASGDPVRELKDMVKAFHKAGMEVLMDLFFTEDTPPGLMLRCMEHWMENYHMDGFRLMGNPDIRNLAAGEPLFSGIKLISEQFDTERLFASGEKPAFRNLAECNGGFLTDARRFLKGDNDLAAACWNRIRQNSDRCAVINYITGHDGYTLADLVSYQERHNEENKENNQDGPAENYSWNCGQEGPSLKKSVLELRFRQMKNAMLLLLLAGGVPMLRAGDEFGNSQNGNNNPYCQDNEIFWLDWDDLKKNQEFFDFVKRAVALRREWTLLHPPGAFTGTDRMGLGYPDISTHGKEAWYADLSFNSHQFGVLYCDGTREETRYCYAAYNLHWQEREFALPRLPKEMEWIPVLASGKILEQTETKSIKVAPRTIQVLIGRK